jgi:hypothetical protein
MRYWVIDLTYYMSIKMKQYWLVIYSQPIYANLSTYNRIYFWIYVIECCYTAKLCQSFCIHHIEWVYARDAVEQLSSGIEIENPGSNQASYFFILLMLILYNYTYWRVCIHVWLCMDIYFRTISKRMLLLQLYLYCPLLL